ncbi:MAG: 16S rRNA (cytosine(1402)-N(4))-methyltransferase RsmH [Gammaproteobacteria bacterium]|nr:16S rRNA (cytosine(1402)-N(4))-methyltransferase RsmH [Gammaproteobacteria bacterium]
MLARFTHVPVLLHESIQGLRIKGDGTYIDCTFGRGGHSQLLLQSLASQGRLFLLDQDPSAIECAQQQFVGDERVTIIHETFANLAEVGRKHGLLANVDGIFFDLGVSSPQLDEAQRGFSFSQDGPLDMRMNTSTGYTAAQWLESVSVNELIQVLREFGEERHAKKIANKVLDEQKVSAITTTKRLAETVKGCYPSNYQGIHPATRTFQAIRIAINKELLALQKGLEASFDLLNGGGRLVVISFHSLEDRMVKRFIRDTKQEDLLPKLPVMPELSDHLKSVGKLIRPSIEELKVNPRARSARLRVAEKVLK